MRLRHRLAQTQRALASVSRKTDACAAEANQCSELRRAFVDLTHPSENLRQNNSRLRWSAGGIRVGAPTRRCMVTRGVWAPRLGSRGRYSPLPLCGVCASVPAPVVAAQPSSCGHAPSLLCRPNATDIAARIGALDHKQAAAAIDGRCTPHVVADFDFRATVGIACDQSIIPLCAQRRWA